jgi:hypothetical protein
MLGKQAKRIARLEAALMDLVDRLEYVHDQRGKVRWSDIHRGVDTSQSRAGGRR